ncbi:Stp1/IreP family PP2C-type Ser/Thr phosphatase [Streptomyces chattanoogensis]|uniref:Serine/threonine protein phosphatase PstP n=1 Tax=Streptomyces chattanoogensis TaxID=66876 RepID=A0A0N0XYA7_9ACTN|nr:Stp1/IreP family PP2C-type Ser/Thr phosphatase [Streptomyces chattanoogensis]KPC65394.1 protein phosphatase [Streptomyces chattanoogensis]
MSLSLRFAAGSHKGMIREGNEDSGYAGPRLLAVADGMGGQAAGEVASSEVISSLVQLDDDVPGSDILTSLGTAVQRANEQLRVMVEEDAQLEGMGTTLTALLWTGQRLGLVHVGDSRAYLLRDGVLTQITQDHTWVQRLVDEGRITEEEATTHPQRSLLMRALGSGDHVEPDLSIREVRAGDRYLICSDGLSGVVSHQTLEETLASYHGPHETVQELIQLALRGGGPDNITCIVADVLDVDGADTMAGQLNDTPVIVGAVAENQHQLSDPSTMQTPAARAAELGRRDTAASPPGGAFGPPGSGGPDVAGPPQGSFGAFTDEDFLKPPRRGKWVKRSLLIALALAVVGGGLYGGYRWTQTQYFVGVNANHVALYRGLSQDLAWISLNSVDEDHPEIELKYLPVYMRNQVKETIPVDSRAQANEKVTELVKQANACLAKEQREAAAREAARNKDRNQTGGTSGGKTGSAGKPGSTAKPGSGDKASKTGSGVPGTLSASATPTPTTSQAPSEEQQKLEKNCSTQQ